MVKNKFQVFLVPGVSMKYVSVFRPHRQNIFYHDNPFYSNTLEISSSSSSDLAIPSSWASLTFSPTLGLAVGQLLIHYTVIATCLTESVLNNWLTTRSYIVG